MHSQSIFAIKNKPNPSNQSQAHYIEDCLYYYTHHSILYNLHFQFIVIFNLMFQQIATAHRQTRDKFNEYCYQHPYRTAKYHNQEKTIYLCTACAIQQASRGIAVTQITKNTAQHFQTPSLSLLQQVYQQSQNDIQQAIRRYNIKYQKLVQTMTDMQIRDLIDFNRKLEQNQSLFKQMKEQTKHEWNRANLMEMFNSSLPEAILDKIDRLTNQMAKQNSLKVVGMRSKPVSPSRFSRRASPQQLNKNKSQTLDIQLIDSSNSQQQAKREISHSFSKSQNQTCSDHSKTSTMQEVKKDELQDTPQSVKDRVSQQGLKVTTNMAVTMFEKIDICQSINMQQKQGKKSRGSICSAKSRHRYDTHVDECVN